MTKTVSNTIDTGFKANNISFKAPHLMLSIPSTTGTSEAKTSRKDWTRYADSRLKQFCSR